MPYFPERKPEVPEEVPEERKAEQPKERPETDRRLWLVLLCLFTVLTVYGAIRLIAYGFDYSASRNTSRELQEVYKEAEPTETPAPAITETAVPTPIVTATPAVTATPVPQETLVSEEIESNELPPVPYPDNPGLQVSGRFTRLGKLSRYIVGWLSMDGLEEAVVQKDNTYFLTHDATGKKNSNGAIFLDEDTDLRTRPYSLIMFGHNMKSGNMFGRLRKYMDRKYLQQHRIIQFDTLYEEGKYAVFTAEKISTVPGTALYYDLWSLNSTDREKREQAIRRLNILADWDSMLDVQADDQILVLVTCVDEDTDRLVVAARRLRESETEEHLTLR